MNSRSWSTNSGQPTLLTGELLRIFERALQNEPGDGIDVDRSDFTSEAHRFEWDRAAAGERIEHARRASSISLADFIAEELKIGARFASPMQDSAYRLLAFNLDAIAGDVFL